MTYIMNSDACIGIPKGSEVELVETGEQTTAIIYKNMWFGYYLISAFTTKEEYEKNSKKT